MILTFWANTFKTSSNINLVLTPLRLWETLVQMKDDFFNEMRDVFALSSANENRPVMSKTFWCRFVTAGSLMANFQLHLHSHINVSSRQNTTIKCIYQTRQGKHIAFVRAGQHFLTARRLNRPFQNQNTFFLDPICDFLRAAILLCA